MKRIGEIKAMPHRVHLTPGGRVMKRTMLTLMLVLICALMSVPVMAAPPTLYNSKTFEVNVDSTAFNVDTVSNVLSFGPLPNRYLQGWFKFDYLTIDSGSSAADIPDTTKDTINVDLYTSGNDGVPARILKTWKVANFMTTSADSLYRVFSVPADSAILDKIYFRIRPAIYDRDTSVAAASAGITYKFTAYITNKP